MRRAWVAHYAAIESERELGDLDITDEEAHELADERLRDDYAERADQINDERWSP